MATTDITNPALGGAFFDFEVQIPGQQNIGISGIIALTRAQFNESIYVNGSASVTLKTTSTDYVNSTLRLASVNGTPLARLRFGIGTPDRISWIPWQTHLILGFEADTEGFGSATGYDVNVVTGGLFHIMDRAAHTASFRGSVSSVVRTIASRNDVENTVIEDTSDTGLWIQSFQGDVSFVRKRLVARARSTRRRGNYHFYARDGVVHFHSPDYQARIVDLNYDGSAHASLTLTDLSQKQVPIGAAGVTMVGYDPYAGKSRTSQSIPDDALRLGNVIPQLSNAAGVTRTMRMHLSENGPSELPIIAQNAYESARSECFKLVLNMDKSRILRAGDILRINLASNTTRTSAWTGTYLVASGSHTITNGSIRSVYALERGEMNQAKNAPAGIVDDVTAPGFDLNVQDTQSSLLTRGSGQETGGTFLTVENPNAATTQAPSLA